jgi:hypothetical protein
VEALQGLMFWALLSFSFIMGWACRALFSRHDLTQDDMQTMARLMTSQVRQVAEQERQKKRSGCS